MSKVVQKRVRTDSSQAKQKKTKTKNPLAGESTRHPPQRHLRRPAGHPESPKPLGGLCKNSLVRWATPKFLSHWPGALPHDDLHSLHTK